MTSSVKTQRLALAGLLALAAVPSLAGAFRLTELAGGADVTPENARFFASPAPVVAHILSAVRSAFWARSSSSPRSAGTPAGTAWSVDS